MREIKQDSLADRHYLSIHFFLSKRGLKPLVKQKKHFFSYAKFCDSIIFETMKLIVGLGNPGKRYTNTRHNVGFLCLDRLIEEFPFTPRISKRIRAIYYTRDRELILAKPHAFVNNSGKVVKDLMERFKVSIKDLLIIHDDLDLPLGEYKMSRSQGSAGHKGVQSIIEKLSSKDFRRIRIGIGRPPFFIPAEKYVLQNFSSEEKKILDSVFVALKEQLKKYLLKK